MIKYPKNAIKTAALGIMQSQHNKEMFIEHNKEMFGGKKWSPATY